MLDRLYPHLGRTPELRRPLTALRGIGPRRAGLLAQKDLRTLADLLLFLPNRYEDRSRMTPIGSAKDGETAWVRGKVHFGGEEKFYRSGKRLFRIFLEDETAGMELIWFHFRKSHLTRFAEEGVMLTAYGKVQQKQGRRQMVHPDIAPADPDSGTGPLGFYPVYPAVNGVSNHVLRSAVAEVLERYGDKLTDPLPEETTRQLGLYISKGIIQID